MSEAAQLSILIAEDGEADRLILESIVRQEGHRVLSASNGREAVEIFRRERPDMVLLDAIMPVQDGFETARQIRRLAGEQLLPILFLTALSDTDSLVRCLAAGGDDFLQKPYSRVILQAKIQAFNRMRDLHATVLAQRNQIVQHNQQLLQEQTLARQVFDNIAHRGCLDASNVRYHLSPRAVFNGDVLLAALRPSGNMMLLLGDFTGHGLPAAIGAMPLASTFYGMVHKGFALGDILRELNDKLHRILPVGMFCCASFIELDFRERRLTLWNGGLPEPWLRRRTGGLQAVVSRHLPLGVLPSLELATDCEHLELEEGDRLFLWTDGIHEACNEDGELFGEGRLRSILAETACGDSYQAIIQAVQDFTAGADLGDDLSLVEVTMVHPQDFSSRTMPSPRQDGPGLMGWKLDFEFRPSTFKYFDPLPLLLGIIAEVPGLRSHSGSIYTVLAELYSNALDHGVLQLDSALKQSPEGFTRYYRLREERLAAVKEGYIRFSLNHDSAEEGGCLRVRVADSGEGFDHHRLLEEQQPAEVYSGRGIGLLRRICESLCYEGCGNEVEAVYRWRN